MRARCGRIIIYPLWEKIRSTGADVAGSAKMRSSKRQSWLYSGMRQTFCRLARYILAVITARERGLYFRRRESRVIFTTRSSYASAVLGS